MNNRNNSLSPRISFVFQMSYIWFWSFCQSFLVEKQALTRKTHYGIVKEQVGRYPHLAKQFVLYFIAVLAMSTSAYEIACFVIFNLLASFYRIVLWNNAYFHYLLRIFFFDMKGVFSVNVTIEPKIPFVRFRCIASLVLGPAEHPSNTTELDSASMR